MRNRAAKHGFDEEKVCVACADAQAIGEVTPKSDTYGRSLRTLIRRAVEKCIRKASISVVLFSATLSVSAALLFLLEPMFTKMILPVLGGSAAVWASCMVFYQAILLAGYAFANIVTRKMNLRNQVLLFVLLTLAPLLILPFGVPPDRVPPVGQNPIPWLMMILAITIGLPFFVTSTMAPTLQKWFEGIRHGSSDDPYFLYAASNAGSMMGLLSYPLLIEPRFRFAEQTRMWEGGYALLAVLLVVCSIPLWRASPEQNLNDSRARELNVARSRPAFRERLLWMVLAFVPSSLMLGVTTVLTTDIPPIPMLWVLPLATYLLSFILVFAKKPLVSSSRIAGSVPLVILLDLVPALMKASWPLFMHICINLVTLFVVAVACHGELAKRRPSPDHLTSFYSWIAFGGVLGGLFNGILAPNIFSTVLEFPLVLICAALLRVVLNWGTQRPFNRLDLILPAALGILGLVLVRVLGHSDIRAGTIVNLTLFGPMVVWCYSFVKRPLRFALGLVALMISAMTYTGVYQHVVITQRSFYGISRVAIDDSGQYRVLFGGSTIHGIQSLSPGRSSEPLSYYSQSGPIGQVFAAFSGTEQLREVGIAGLGAGSMACYRTAGEEFTFYEIDPVVVRIARDPRYFTFLRDCAPQAHVILGDARISLKNAAARNFGMLVVDVFGGDSIPVHLLTREAVQLYLSKLSDHGIVVFHISNRYLRLQKVVGNLASDAGLVALMQDDLTIGAGKTPSTWVVLARNRKDFGKLTTDSRWLGLTGDPNAKVWTDDYSSVLTVLNWENF